ncbi:flagellar hook-basal body complex protein FliE [Oceanibacterium hippocampi]|uniref:Flagellar hook-basal body complex protein FliE n=1 Tax=Oceanibacterium hippocampi TaxID=745714 RepID=A0A1Y5TZL1_9PROT|nr:flagellar hook-basal body complex protein FliE [Oceanibacterium hippocampi]SLN76823.1 flagellar hook-basal body protein FliE [Oceanibacterium hippocampi]
MESSAVNAALAYARAISNAENAGNIPGDDLATDAAGAGGSFASLLQDAGKDMVAGGQTSEELSLRAVARDANVADVVAAVSNAEVTLETVVTVRDRIIQAYQDIIKMPI